MEQEWWREQGYVYGRELEPGLWVCVAEMMFTWRLMLCGETNAQGVHEFWCYPKEKFTSQMVTGFAMAFSGKGDPARGWVKHHPSERRPFYDDDANNNAEVVH